MAPVCYGAGAMKIPLALACVIGLALVPLAQRSEKDLSPRERERLMAAMERAVIRERAALDAEAVAEDLRATADELDRLSARAEAAAAAAEKDRPDADAPKVVLPLKPTRPRQAERRAAEQPLAPAPTGQEPPRDGGGPAPRVRPPDDRPIPLECLSIEEAEALIAPIHAAATRTSEENKQAYLPKKRASRVRSASRTRGTGYTFGPGQAPDIGDIDFYAEWQWCLNVSRGGSRFRGARPGSVAKTGHVDLARLTIQPDKGTISIRA